MSFVGSSEGTGVRNRNGKQYAQREITSSRFAGTAPISASYPLSCVQYLYIVDSVYKTRQPLNSTGSMIDDKLGEGAVQLPKQISPERGLFILFDL